MTKRSPAAARALAATALICAFLVLVVVIAASLDTGGNNHVGGKARGGGGKNGHAHAAAYVVQNGDTLSSIAHKTGVSVARIQKLNRGIDPQILISGEKLKLR